MALVRRGTKVYCYQSYRSRGRVTSRYVGSGELAIACDSLDALSRAQDARLRARFRKKTAALDAKLMDLNHRMRQTWLRYRETAGAADDLLAAWDGRVEGVFREAMSAAGCRQHKGTWRKKRMTARERAEAEERCRDLWVRLGDCQAEVRREVLARDGDPAARVVEELIDRVVGSHPSGRAALAAEVARVRTDLEGPNPSPVEILLAERAAVSWLASYEADLVCLRAEGAADAKLTEFHQKRRDRAHRRFRSASKALAVFRRLAVQARRPRDDFRGRLADAAHAR